MHTTQPVKVKSLRAGRADSPSGTSSLLCLQAGAAATSHRRCGHAARAPSSSRISGPPALRACRSGRTSAPWWQSSSPKLVGRRARGLALLPPSSSRSVAAQHAWGSTGRTRVARRYVRIEDPIWRQQHLLPALRLHWNSLYLLRSRHQWHAPLAHTG